MKHYTREQLQGIAADVFGRYPNARTVACTEDGVPFITDETEYPLKEHARVAGKYTGGLKIEYFRRCDMPAPETSAETETAETPKPGEVRQTVLENITATSAPVTPKAPRKTGAKRKNTGKKATERKTATSTPEAPAGETTAQAETLSPASPATETATPGGNNKLLKV